MGLQTLHDFSFEKKIRQLFFVLSHFAFEFIWIICVCVCVCVSFYKTNNVEIHSKLIWFGSFLYRWRGISNFWIVIFNFSFTFFFSSYVGLINNLRVSAFACISYVNVCVYIKMNVNLSFLCFFFSRKNNERLTDIRQR